MICPFCLKQPTTFFSQLAYRNNNHYKCGSCGKKFVVERKIKNRFLNSSIDFFQFVLIALAAASANVLGESPEIFLITVLVYLVLVFFIRLNRPTAK